MSILRDINTALKNARGLANDLKIQSNTMKGSSLAKMSSAATLQFPIIITKSITMDTAQSVSKALERQYASFVQIVISLNPHLNLDEDKNMTGYLRKIHQNEIGAMDLLESCTNVYSDEAYGVHLFMSINNGSNGQIVASNKNQLFTIEESLNHSCVNDLYKPANISLPVAESALVYYCKKNNIVMEAVEDDIEKATNDFELKKAKTMFDVKVTKADKEMGTKIDEYNKVKDIARAEIDNQKFIQQLKKDEAEYRNRAIVKLSDNDVKKSNELVPTTLSVSMNVLKGDNSVGNENYVIGVKGLLHPVNSNDMVSNLLDGHKSGNKFFNFIRWTTGEISFIKDLLFNVDGIKEDVVKKYNGGSHWWTTLKRRKTLAKARNSFGKNKLLPNASIVCSMEEIMEMKDTYGVDLMESKNVKRLMDRYFLLGFVVVDEAQELCHFIFDGESNYQVVSFRGLEKENNSKNDFKEIYKMINSGRL